MDSTNQHRCQLSPSQLLSEEEKDRIANQFANSPRTPSARALLCPVVSKHFYNIRTIEVDEMDLRHDASFMGYRPTVSFRFPEAVAMKNHTLTVGRGWSNDLQLDRYGNCTYTTLKHAEIFHDEVRINRTIRAKTTEAGFF